MIENICRAFTCEKFNFTKQELEEIQKEEFVISNEKAVIFEGGDIGILNDRFLEKFPLAERFVFMNAKITLDESEEPMKHQVEEINFQRCQIVGSKNTQFFRNLLNLSGLGFSRCEFDHGSLEKNLFGNDSKITQLALYRNNFQAINNDAFEGLRSLETLSLTADLEELPPHLLSKLVKLKELDLSENQLQTVPCDAIPESVEEIIFFRNNIQKPSFEGCRFLKSLKKLNLIGNDIKSIEETTFEPLENLEELRLDFNKIKAISNAHFQNLKHLKEINLKGNGFETTDIRREIIVEL